jgi:hypothetical protein
MEIFNCQRDAADQARKRNMYIKVFSIARIYVFHKQNVYDLSQFRFCHPGGRNVISKNAGKDISNVESIINIVPNRPTYSSEHGLSFEGVEAVKNWNNTC